MMARRAAAVLRTGLVALFVVGVASCDSVPTDIQPPPVAAGIHPHLSDTDIAAEVARLRQVLAEQAVEQAEYGPDGDHAWMTAALAELAGSLFVIDRLQLVVVVDRSPAVQRLRIMLAEPGARWRTIGGGKVSTGQSGRRGYFITPIGVFRHTAAIADYRALGTCNEQGIRGLGAKGMRVWDFGWQAAVPGWGADRGPRDIRLLMHATDPTFLEPRLGRPASQGCIRIASGMNRFLDRQGILDAEHERVAGTDERIARVLHPERTPSRLAGSLLIIIDSSQN